jgi:hypothetical protein
MRGGNFYGVVGGDSGLGTAGARYDAVPNTEVDHSGNPVPDAVMRGVTGGRRRRTGKKGTRKSRRVSRRRRTMRGGASYVGSPNSGASYAGKGIGGMADYGGYAANTPGAGFNHQQVAGVWQV